MIGIAQPAGAAGLVAVAVLVILHLLARRRRTVPVSTLRLWRRLPPQAVERRRFRPDLLFLLQAALLLALTAGLLQPYLAVPRAAGGARALVAVIDVSASMQTREAAGTRIDLARQRVRALVDELAPGLEVMLITAGARPAVTLRWTTDHGVARAGLETLEALDVGTSLAPAVDLALGSAEAHGQARVVLLTDVARERSGVAGAMLARLDYVAIGTTDDNVGLTGLRVEAPPFGDPHAAVAVVEVRNASRVARRVTLTVRVDERPWTTRSVPLPPRGALSIPLAAPPAAGLVTVVLEDGDALGADDRALAWIPAATPLDLVVASEDERLVHTMRALAASVPGARVQVVSPTSPGAPPARAGATLVLDGLGPATPLRGPVLVIAPPAAGSPCTTLRRHASAAVVDWDETHPALAGLVDLHALELTDVRELSVPAGATSVVLAAAPGVTFPLLVAGELGGQRLACLGARLAAPLAAPDDLPLLLLVLGTLRWLAEPPDAAPIAIATGAPVAIGGAEAVVVERVGARTIETPAGPRLVVANLFDADETDVGRDDEGEWPGTAAVVPTDPAGARTDLTWWPILAGALLAAVEWGVWALA